MVHRNCKPYGTAAPLGIVVLFCFLAVSFFSSCAGSPDRKDSSALENARRNKDAAVARMGTGPGAQKESPGAVSPGSPGSLAEPGIAPDWIVTPPLSDEEYYYGVGRASLEEDNPATLARERALAEIAGQIAVTVRRETSDYIGEKTDGKVTQSQQEIEETIRTSADARLRNPEVVNRYQGPDMIHVLARVSKKTALNRYLKEWTRSLGLARFRAGGFLDSRGINTGFGEFLRDSIISQCASSGTVCVEDRSVTEISGKYVVLSGSISVTIRATDTAGSIVSQKMFTVPSEPDYLAMMTSRRDHSLVNAVPRAEWGGGELYLPTDVFREGEEFVITFIPKEDCYVHIFNVVEGGTVTLLVPNRFQGDNFVKGGDRFVFPDLNQKQKGIVLKAYLPSDKANTRESIKVVATQRPVDLAAGGFVEAVMESYRADSEGIRRLLATLQGLDDRGIQWFEEVQYFSIRAR